MKDEEKDQGIRENSKYLNWYQSLVLYRWMEEVKNKDLPLNASYLLGKG